MHGQRRDAHVHGAHRQPGSDDRADRGPAAHAASVDEVLHGHAGLFGGEQERSVGRRIGGIAGAGADLHHRAAAERDLVVRLVPGGIVGVRRVRHVGRDVHRTGDRPQELVARATAGEHGAFELPAQPRAPCAGHRLAAYLLMVEQRQRADVLRRGLAGYRGQRGDARMRASQVIQPC